MVYLWHLHLLWFIYSNIKRRHGSGYDVSFLSSSVNKWLWLIYLFCMMMNFLNAISFYTIISMFKLMPSEHVI